MPTITHWKHWVIKSIGALGLVSGLAFAWVQSGPNNTASARPAQIQQQVAAGAITTVLLSWLRGDDDCQAASTSRGE